MTKRNTLLKGFLAAAVLGSATLVGCGGSSKAPVDANVAAVGGTFNLAQVAGRGASAAPTGFRLVAISRTAAKVRATLGGTENAATFSLNLARGHKWTLRLARIVNGNDVFLFPIRYPYTGGTSNVLPLDGTLTTSTFNFGSFNANAVANGIENGSPVVVGVDSTGGTNPLTQITSGGQSYATSTTLATTLDTEETQLDATVAANDSGTGSTCKTLAGVASTFTATAAPGAGVTISGTGLPTTGVYAALVSGSTVVTGFGASTTVNRSNKDCVATATAAVAVTGTSTSLGFTVPTTATPGTTGTLAIFTAPQGLTPSKLLRLGTFTVATSTGDTTAPTITSTFPVNGSTTVPANTTQGLVEFSEAMNTTLTPTITMTVTNTSTGGTVVTAGTAEESVGTVAWATDGESLTYTLNNGAFTLNEGSAYSYTLTVDVSTIKDSAGNNLNLSGSSLSGATVTNTTGTTYTIAGTFTVTAADTTAPTITATSPANASAVAANTTSGTITFSEAMNTTLTPTITVEVANTSTGGTVVTAGTGIATVGSVAWADNGQSLTYTLTNTALTLNSGSNYSYTITIDTNTIKDAVGNKLNLTGSSLSNATVTNTTGDTYTVAGTFSVQ